MCKDPFYKTPPVFPQLLEIHSKFKPDPLVGLYCCAHQQLGQTRNLAHHSWQPFHSENLISQPSTVAATPPYHLTEHQRSTVFRTYHIPMLSSWTGTAETTPQRYQRDVWTNPDLRACLVALVVIVAVAVAGCAPVVPT